jgi:hypothetical protein
MAVSAVSFYGVVTGRRCGYNAEMSIFGKNLKPPAVTANSADRLIA